MWFVLYGVIFIVFTSKDLPSDSRYLWTLVSWLSLAYLVKSYVMKKNTYKCIAMNEKNKLLVIVILVKRLVFVIGCSSLSCYWWFSRFPLKWHIRRIFVGFFNVIHAMKTIKQSYSRVSRILLDKSRVF